MGLSNERERVDDVIAGYLNCYEDLTITAFSFEFFTYSLVTQTLLVPFVIMSKRSAPASEEGIKLIKLGDVWRMLEDDPKEDYKFKPVEGGPKARIFKSCVLNYNPRVDICVSLEGFYPEVRLTGPDGSFTMTGDEFLEMSNIQAGPQSADRVRLEPVMDVEQGGYRLARYNPTDSGMNNLYPQAVFNMNKYTAKRLKEKLTGLRDHVCALKAGETVIRLMFDCVVDAYEREYALLHSSQPIHDIFSEVSRIVEVYVPPVMILSEFVDKLQEQRLVSTFNHYGLLSAVLPQKTTLFGKCL